MSFWGTLAKIAGDVASPFTFGLSGIAGNMIGNKLNAADAAKAGGDAISAANTAAGQNRQDTAKLALQGNEQNIQGMGAYENALMNRAKLDQQQRNDALKNIYRQSFTTNFKGSPYNPVGPMKQSQNYIDALAMNADQGMKRLANPMAVDLTKASPIRYNPLDVKDIMGSTGNSQGLLSKIASWAGPAMTIGGNLAGRTIRQPKPTVAPTDDTESNLLPESDNSDAEGDSEMGG